MKNVLIYDFHSSGHHIEYIEYLSSLKSNDVQFFFGINKKAKDYLAIQRKRVRCIEICSDIKSKKEEFNWISRQLLELSIDQLYFLNIDPYLVQLTSFEGYNKNLRIGGILFDPPHRIEVRPHLSLLKKLKYKLKRMRNYRRLKNVVTNEQLTTLHILDDNDGIKTLNEKIKPVFNYLPDPIISKRFDFTKEELCEKYNLVIDKPVLLVFGSIIPRKNIEILISATLKEDIQILIVGKGGEEYVNKLNAKAKNHKSKVVIVNKFVENEEMEELFSSCDFISIIYKDFFGSSGVLGRAAKYDKKVICSTIGLIEFLVKKHNLGIAVNNNIDSIKKGLRSLVELDFDKNNKSKSFIEDKTIENFRINIHRSFLHEK